MMMVTSSPFCVYVDKQRNGGTDESKKESDVVVHLIDWFSLLSISVHLSFHFPLKKGKSSTEENKDKFHAREKVTFYWVFFFFFSLEFSRPKLCENHGVRAHTSPWKHPSTSTRGTLRENKVFSYSSSFLSEEVVVNSTTLWAGWGPTELSFKSRRSLSPTPPPTAGMVHSPSERERKGLFFCVLLLFFLSRKNCRGGACGHSLFKWLFF